MYPSSFFAYARERHAIYLRREMGIPRDQLTEDPILQTYRFCNVFRELDTTTIWLRENVRECLRDVPEVLMAIVVYRWFNRWQTGEVLFGPDVHSSPFQQFLLSGRTHVIRDTLRRKFPKGPYVTGSYIIKTPDGMTKLDGVCWSIGNFHRTGPGDRTWQQIADHLLSCPEQQSTENVWGWLRMHRFLGDFMAYEIVSDLQHTDLLCQASDIMTWANAGPGAVRGLNRLHARKLEQKAPKKTQCLEMRELLEMSRNSCHWPQWDRESFVLDADPPRDWDKYHLDAWPMWDMRTVEHTLCEFDKYERVRLGEGAPRQKFRRM